MSGKQAFLISCAQTALAGAFVVLGAVTMDMMPLAVAGSFLASSACLVPIMGGK